MSAAALVPTDGLGAWQRFLCRACGLIYDEGDGDPDSGLPPGTRFADIPDQWECPICGVTKTDFEPYVPRARASRHAVAANVRPRGTGVVIVGGGAAGWSVVEAIRRLDAGNPVTLVTACNGDIYNKPELSVALSRGLSPETLRRDVGASRAGELDVGLVAQAGVVGLSTAVRRLRTTRGTMPYTNLVLALGARPALPPSLPAALCWRVNDLQAWSGLVAQLAGSPKQVAIVGAGMVGCELAEDFARAGHNVTLLERAALPLATLLPERASERLVAGLRQAGVAFRGGVVVRRVEAVDGGAKSITLDDGTHVAADVVVAATGLATEARFVRSAGLAFDNGIVVDPVTLRTNAPYVYALGDCASIGGMACRYIEPIAKQAEAIAHAIIGREHAGYSHAPPTIRLKTRSAPIVLRGAPGPGEWRVIEDGPERLLMEQWRDGEIAVRLAA